MGEGRHEPEMVWLPVYFFVPIFSAPDDFFVPLSYRVRYGERRDGQMARRKDTLRQARRKHLNVGGSGHQPLHFLPGLVA